MFFTLKLYLLNSLELDQIRIVDHIDKIVHDLKINKFFNHQPILEI